MNTESALRALIATQSIAALGTLHRGEPYVSMVPFAFDAQALAFLIHVSALAPHTKDMLMSPRVSLLIVAPDADSPSPQARARATVQGDAQALDRDTPAYEHAKSIYLTRFPHAADIFALGDFTIFRIRPASVRLIGGFAQAQSLVGDALAQALRTGLPS